ncbi:MAG: hypothetical protein ACTHK5_07935 [Tsuneonella sp.]
MNHRTLTALLLAIVSAPALAQQASAGQPDSSPASGDIVVTADRAMIAALRGIAPEREYSEEEISGYGSSTVGEVIDEVRAENGDDDVVFLVNGEPVSGVDDIADFPAEAVQRLEILPRGSGQRIGREADRRVYNVVLKDRLRSLALTASRKVATEGAWGETSGEAIGTSIAGRERLNFTLRARDSDGLTEADRGIIQPSPRDSIGAADYYELIDGGAFRTLRSPAKSYEASLIGSAPIRPWLTSSYSFVGRINRGNSLSGLPYELFLLPGTSPFSPGGADQRLILFGADPLVNRSEGRSLNGNMTLNATRGSWIASLTGQFSFNHQRYDNERLAAPFDFDPINVPAGRNPFVDPLGEFFATRFDSSTTDQRTYLARLNVGGPIFRLPAGDVRVRAAVQQSGSRSHTVSNQAFGAGDRTVTRALTGIDGGIDIPLFSSEFLPALGELTVSLDRGYDFVDRYANLNRSSISALWQPSRQLSITALTSSSEELPYLDFLAGPVILYRNVRTFDFLTGQTVDAAVITGGNPNLASPSTRTRRLSINAAPLPKYNLQLNFDYEVKRVRGLVSSVPAASTPVFLAFPDRFQRDAAGRLATVDTRAVNFDRESTKQIRYGLSFFLPLGPSQRSVGGDGNAGVETLKPIPPGARPRLQFTASDTLALSDCIVIRPGLPAIDLLKGGAIGLGGGQSRHLVNGSFAFTTANFGVRFTELYRSASSLLAGTAAAPQLLRFRPLSTTNMRAFADLGPLLPAAPWLKNTRLSFSIENIGNARQRVLDDTGRTPLRYQGAYRDPVGRTVELELRKSF